MRNVGLRRFREQFPQQATPGDRAHPVMEVRHFSASALRPARVVLARVPFRESDDYKIRPCVIEAVIDDGLRVRPCTSSYRGRSRAGAVQVSDLAAAGLTRPTWIRSDTVHIPLCDVIELAGELSDEDGVYVLSRADFGTAA